jgi:hypothetical protein
VINWIKVEFSTPDKPEIFAIAKESGLDPDAVFGKLMRVWIWADQQTIDGNADGVTKTAIDRIAYHQGFADAMIYAGWLGGDDGSLSFSNFERHNGKGAKKRDLTNRRVAEHRQNVRETKRDGNANCNAQGVTKSVTRGRSEEDIKNPLTPTGESPGGEESQKLCGKQKPVIDYQAVADAYNEILGARLPQVASLNDKRKRQIKALQPQLSNPSLEGWRAYFEAFNEEAKPFFFGDNNRGWQASFDYLLRSDTLIKIREGSL